MFGRGKTRVNNTSGAVDAQIALQKSLEEYQSVEAMRPEVEKTVRGHIRLLQENHFSERLWLAFEGEAAK